jgi:hypothetical protein
MALLEPGEPAAERIKGQEEGGTPGSPVSNSLK